MKLVIKVKHKDRPFERKVRRNDPQVFWTGFSQIDVCGPLEEPSIVGARYFVTFMDKQSKWVTVLLMKRNPEVAGCNSEILINSKKGRQNRQNCQTENSDLKFRLFFGEVVLN